MENTTEFCYLGRKISKAIKKEIKNLVEQAKVYSLRNISLRGYFMTRL